MMRNYEVNDNIQTESHGHKNAQMLNGISPLHTSCKDCIFVEYGGWGTPIEKKIQAGCSLNMVYTTLGIDNEPYLKHIDDKTEVLEIEEDNGNSHFVLNDMKCHYKRLEKWGGRVKKDQWATRVKQESRMKYQIILFAGDSLDDIKKTYQSYLDQSLPPQHITVVRLQNNPIRPSNISNYLKTQNLPWRIENMLDEDMMSVDMIDYIMKKRPYPYYVVDDAGHTFPNDFFETINTQIYDYNFKFAILESVGEYWSSIISTSIHYAYEGNRPTDLLTKLRENKCDNLIVDAETVYPMKKQAQKEIPTKEILPY